MSVATSGKNGKLKEKDTSPSGGLLFHRPPQARGRLFLSFLFLTRYALAGRRLHFQFFSKAVARRLSADEVGRRRQPTGGHKRLLEEEM